MVTGNLTDWNDRTGRRDRRGTRPSAPSRQDAGGRRGFGHRRRDRHLAAAAENRDFGPLPVLPDHVIISFEQTGNDLAEGARIGRVSRRVERDCGPVGEFELARKGREDIGYRGLIGHDANRGRTAFHMDIGASDGRKTARQSCRQSQRACLLCAAPCEYACDAT